MKELVGKLSRGQVEYSLPQVDVSVISIEKNIEAGLIYCDSFEVFNKLPGEIKGIVYSTNEYLTITENQFLGKINKIEYRIDTRVLEPGDEIKGRINIVTNGGEVYVPFDFRIKEESIECKTGKVSNMFHFINLVKEDYDEAQKMFLSDKFEKIVLKDNIEDICMYRGLIKNADKRLALEEFIIAINKKQQVEFDISEPERTYKNISDSYGDMVVLTKSTWGILDIKISTDCDFITEYKKNITDEDFAGNNYEYSYLIDRSKLHAGINYGRIIFKTVSQTKEFRITVDNRKEHDMSRHEIKKAFIEMNKVYLDFRMRKCSLDKWIEISQNLVEHARGYRDDDPFLRLFEAQVYISKKDDEKAKWLIDSVTEQILAVKEDNIPLYCYYLYINALQIRELEYTFMVTDTIKKYYENGYDKWELLWILLYIDPSFENNKSLKLARIKEQYNLGCRSTLMYYEALYALNRQPMLLRMVNDFELQVLNFASKYDAIDLRLAVQLAEISVHEKKFRPILFNILTRLYKKFENKVILNAILSTLIRGNMTNQKYFQWFELGVKQDIQITGLYEYYVSAIPDDFQGDIPETVLMYFVYNSSLLGIREAFYYSLIIRDKENHPNVYKNYAPNIEKFALDRLKSGKIDEYLAVVYQDILSKELIMEENEKMLSKVLNTWMLRTDNKNIREVLVIHKETDREMVYPLIRGRAYVEIYTDDAIILFKDFKGNTYLNTVDYKIEKLLNRKDLNEVSLSRNSENIFVMARECEQSIKYHKRLFNGNELFTVIMADDKFRSEFKDNILDDIIEYYLDNYDGEKLDEYLKGLNVNKLNRKSRITVSELMIMRGLYNEVLEILDKYGSKGIEDRKLLKLCTSVIRENIPCNEESLIGYCDKAFKKGKYNEESLKLLLSKFNGTTKDMLELFRVSKEFDIEDRDLEERIIAQMLFSRSSIESICVVYESYYRLGTLDMIKKAYFFYVAYSYFVKKEQIDNLYFVHLEDEINSGNQIHDICKCAYLLVNSEKKNIREVTKNNCKEFIDQLAKKKIIFDFYKKYSKWFEIKGDVLNHTTVEYRCSSVDKVLVNYYIDNGNNAANEYVSEDMIQVFGGLYIKSFVLFYGEKINYYIMEVKGEDTTITSSEEHILDDRGINTSLTRYGRLNDLLVCSDMKEDTISNLITDYYVNNEMVKELFLKS